MEQEIKSETSEEYEDECNNFNIYHLNHHLKIPKKVFINLDINHRKIKF